MIFDYDYEAVKDDLMKLMRIQNYDVELKLLSDAEMYLETDRKDIKGHCYRWRELLLAQVCINTSSIKSDIDWLTTMVHELYHILSDDYVYSAECILDHVDEKVRKPLDENNTIQYERLTSASSRAMVNMLGPDYLEKFKLKRGDTHEETENS